MTLTKFSGEGGQAVYKAPGVAAAAVVTTVIGTQGHQFLRVWWKATNALAGTDIGSVSVKGHDAANVLVNEALTPVVTNAPIFGSPVASKSQLYDVTAYSKVTLSVANAAATARDLEVHVIQQ